MNLRTQRGLAVLLVGLSVSAVWSSENVDRSPEQLTRLLQQLDQLPASSPLIQPLRTHIDSVAAQRYGWASRLYWHTDLADAQAVAKREGKPILSLRMLGNLTDELSCANSRFFRTALYANQSISKQLRERFVLHWSSERPVPVLTVDFGDGRVMKRTVTGNSIHYLLDPEGQPLDAMPGLVGPAAFVRWLDSSQMVWQAVKGATASDRPIVLQQIQQRLLNAQRSQWDQDLAKLALTNPAAMQGMTAAITPQSIDDQIARLQATLNNPSLAQSAQPAQPAQPVRAERAVVLATPKRAAEMRFIPQLTMSGRPILDDMGGNLDFWKAVAELHLEDAKLDDSSRRLIAWQRPYASEAGSAAMESLLAEFERNMALDTVRNQYLLQRKLRNWQIQKPLSLTDLNRRVYSELFLTPREDPFLGLLPGDAYTGLERSGLDAAAVPSATPRSTLQQVNNSPVAPVAPVSQRQGSPAGGD